MQHPLDDPLAARVKDCVLRLLAQHHRSEGICPREAARTLAVEFGFTWEDMMRLVRTVVADLVTDDVIEVLQNGTPVDIREARGPVRLHLKTR